MTTRPRLAGDRRRRPGPSTTPCIPRWHQPVVLILDDYHLLTGVPAHHLIAALIAHMPASLRVVIASSADPALPMGRLRAIGAMEEIRADQLRFDPDEANRFLNGSLDLNLDPASRDTLEERTEGWPAGLYLAALTLQPRPDRAAFVAEFAGSSRHVVDYLSAEVLDGLPPNDRSFLLPTSILGSLSGPLCDAVSGMIGSAAASGSSSGPTCSSSRSMSRDLVPLPSLVRRASPLPARGQSQISCPSSIVEPRDGMPSTGPWTCDRARPSRPASREWAATMLVRSWREFARRGQFQTFERLLATIGDPGPLAGLLAIVVGSAPASWEPAQCRPAPQGEGRCCGLGRGDAGRGFDRRARCGARRLVVRR